MRPTAEEHGSSASILLTNLWSDDNKGDLAITAGLLHAITTAHDGAVLSGVSCFGATEHRHAHRFVSEALTQIYEPVWRPHTGVRVAPLRRSLDMLAAIATLLHPHLATRLLRRNRPLVDALSRSDVVIAKGGQYLHDRSASLRDQLGFLRQVHVLLLALRMHRPIVLAGHSLRPPRGWLAAAVLRVVVRRARSWWIRETESLVTAQELAPAHQVVVGADTAFALADGRRRDPAAGAGGPILLVPRWVPGRAVGEDGHLRAIADAVSPLGDHRPIAVVAQGLGPSPLETDTPCAERLQELLAERGVDAEVLSDDLDLSELIDLYGQAAVVVAVRLHAAILSMVAGTPAVAIGYDGPKTSGLYAKASLSHLAFDSQGIDVEALHDAIVRAMTDPGLRREVRRFADGEAAWVMTTARTLAPAPP